MMSDERDEGILCVAICLWVALLASLLVIGRSPHGLPRGVSEHYYAFELVLLPFVAWLQVFLTRGALSKTAAAASAAYRTAIQMVTAFILVIVVPDWIALSLEALTQSSFMASLFPTTQLLAGIAAFVVAFRSTRSFPHSLLATFACVLPAALFLR